MEVEQSGMEFEQSGMVEQSGRPALNKIDKQRKNAASRLDAAAAKVHRAADAGGQRVSSVVHSAAEKIQSTADYLRGHDSKELIGNVENMVRKHPGRALLIALSFGFIAGRALRHDSSS